MVENQHLSQTYRWLGRARTVAWFTSAFSMSNDSAPREEQRKELNSKIRDLRYNKLKLRETSNTVVQNEFYKCL